MAVDHIRYDLLAQDALRGVVRDVLIEAAKKGLPGEHHFFISFDTRADGVKLSSRLRAQYPEEMTIVLQHQFWDLRVNEENFEVGLSFGGVAERLLVPFVAIKSFVDPSVQFALQFEQITEAQEEAAAEPAKPEKFEKPEKSAQDLNKPRRQAKMDAGKSDAAKLDTGKSATKRSVPSVPRIPAKPLASAPLSTAALADPKPAAPVEGDPDKPKNGGEVVRLDRFRKK